MSKQNKKQKETITNNETTQETTTPTTNNEAIANEEKRKQLLNTIENASKQLLKKTNKSLYVIVNDSKNTLTPNKRYTFTIDENGINPNNYASEKRKPLYTREALLKEILTIRENQKTIRDTTTTHKKKLANMKTQEEKQKYIEEEEKKLKALCEELGIKHLEA